jgi:MFS family permease
VTAPSASAARLRLAGRGRAWLALSALIAAYVLAFVDRQAPSLLVEQLKRDLGLSDTRVSLILGPAFAVLLALAGVPLSRRIDSGRRMPLIALAVAFWSLMTAGGGLATGFADLAICRMGVGIGEAVLTPAAHSVIADSFPARRLGLALGLYGAGAFMGMGLAYTGGGLLLQAFSAASEPWRAVFVAIGAPGLLVAAWIALLPEPAHGSASRAEAPPLASVLGFFWRHRAAVASIDLSLAFAAMSAYAVSAWAPSLMIRAYGWSAAQAGAALGPIVATTGILASLAGGAAADAAARRWRAGRLGLLAGCALAAAPFAAAAPLAEGPGACLALLAGGLFFTTAAISIGPSAQQALAPAALRGAMSMTGVLVVNLLGLGLGPPLVAIAAGHLAGGLGRALAWLAPAMLLASGLIGAAGLSAYDRSLRATDRTS